MEGAILNMDILIVNWTNQIINDNKVKSMDCKCELVLVNRVKYI